MNLFQSDWQRIYAHYQYVHDTGDYTSVDERQVFSHLQSFMRSAPEEEQQHILSHYFQQLSLEQRIIFSHLFPAQYELNPDDPQQMVGGFRLVSQQQPALLRGLLMQSAGDGIWLMKGIAISVVVLSEGRFLSSDEASSVSKQQRQMQYRQSDRQWDFVDDDYDSDRRKQRRDFDEDVN
jgi:hypothetical protein